MVNLPGLDAVLKALAEVIDEPELDPRTPLAKLNVDSLAVLEWLHQLEEDHGLTLTDEFVASVNARDSIEDVYQKLVGETT